MTEHARPLQVTEVHGKLAFLMYTNTFSSAVSLHLRSQMVFLGLCSNETTPKYILYSDLVYMIECIM